MVPQGLYPCQDKSFRPFHYLVYQIDDDFDFHRSSLGRVDNSVVTENRLRSQTHPPLPNRQCVFFSSVNSISESDLLSVCREEGPRSRWEVVRCQSSHDVCRGSVGHTTPITRPILGREANGLFVSDSYPSQAFSPTSSGESGPPEIKAT